MPRRLALGHTPTPLWRHDALDDLVGAEVWVKRDDMTGGAEAGNKVRKLEYLLAEARERGATTLLTCGGVQSNHARATALFAAYLGMRCVLFLRSGDGKGPGAPTGNLLVDRMAGAEIRFITPAEYAGRANLMRSHAGELTRAGERPYVIPEGGSNGLGALGYVEAMREVRAQLDVGLGGGPAGFDAVCVACGSGGSAAGVALGARQNGVAPRTLAIAVCDDRAYFEKTIARVLEEAHAVEPELGRPNEINVFDEFKGPAYGVASPEQIALICEVTRRSGLVLDHCYAGKALFGLVRCALRPRRVLFIHTGGLLGLAAASDQVAAALGY